MATEAGFLTDAVASAFGACVEDEVGDGILDAVRSGARCKLWEEFVESMEDGRGEVVEVGEMVGQGDGEVDGLFVGAHVEARCGSSDGAAHCDYEIRNGTSVGVHEAKTPLRDGDVGDEHGCFWDGGIVGKS